MTDPTTTTIALESAINAMGKDIFDVTIICTTDDHQAEYWTKRLSEGVCKKDSTKGSIFPIVLAVSEDWGKGGAGNGLGTLYAFTKACRVAKEKHGVDLSELLTDGKVSAAIYHTAGKGTRLAPLPASENNNKPGVKLPFCHELSDGTTEPITVLEAVVKQTGIYSKSRAGRLSVYWGDQVFIPSAVFQYTPTHHIDIMCTLLGETAPTAEEWVEQGLDKYGVIAVSSGPGKNAAQVEKVDHATAIQMLQSLGDIGSVGPSLGSFSVSAKMLNALCEEFSGELSAKEGKLDTDPHFWMPMTLSMPDYISLMSQKGVDKSESEAHYKRIGKMKESFLGDKSNESMGLFGAVDVGKDACWWDYGQLKWYYGNNMKILGDDENSRLLRKFLGVTGNSMYSDIDSEVKVDDTSCLFASSLKSGAVKGSVLASVNALEVDAEDAIIVNCVAKKIKAGKGAILYNLVDESDEGIVAGEGEVIVSVTEESGEQMILKSNTNTCGGKAWKTVLDVNTLSFEQVHEKNKDANVSAIEKMRKELFKKASSSFGQ